MGVGLVLRCSSPPPKKKTDGKLLHAGPKICEVSCLKEDLAEADRHKLNDPDSTC